MKNHLFSLFFYVVLLIQCFLFYFKPIYNMDMVLYMGVIFEKENVQDFHANTYKYLEEEVSHEKFLDLTVNSTYREAMYFRSDVFKEQLPYYKIRVLYLWLISLFYGMGIPLIKATILPNILAVFGMGLLLFEVLKKQIHSAFLASMAIIAVLSSFSMIELAGLSTPDGISAFLLLCMAHIYLLGKWRFLLYGLMVLSVLTRTDNLIWCGLLLGLDSLRYYFATKKFKHLIYNGVAGIVLLLIYMWINDKAQNAGWAVIVYNTLVERQLLPLTHTPKLTISNYLEVFARSLPRALSWFAFCAFILGILVKYWRSSYIYSTGIVLLITTIVTVFLRYALFPVFWWRTFNFSALLIFILLLIVKSKGIVRAFSEKKNT